MANKKKKKKGSPKRRSRVSGVSGSFNTSVAGGVILGVVGSRFANNLVKKQFPTLDPKIAAGIPVAAGFVMAANPLKLKFLNSPMIKAAGYGLMAGGALNLATELKMIGAADTPILLKRRVAGAGNMQVLAGGGNTQLLAGNGGGGRSAYAYNNVPFVAGPTMNGRRRYPSGGM